MLPRRRLAPLLLLATLALPATAAAAPGNDDRDDAQPIARLPLALTGDLRGAGLEKPEPGSGCGDLAGSVWFRIDPGRTRRVIVRVAAAGDLDATVDVFERVRSDDRGVTCDRSDANGRAAAAFNGVRGHSYLVRVARREGARADRFRLTAEPVDPALRLPGPALPPGGVGATLDRLQRTANAWSIELQEGVRYRVALSHPGRACIGGTLVAPGARLADRPVAMLGCEGYALVTPRTTGRYAVVVRAAAYVRGPQPYRLQVARAGRDDSAPGRDVANYARVRGRLDGRRSDRLDLYSFDVTRRSVLFMRLRVEPRRRVDVRLLDTAGRQIKCACGRNGPVELRKGLQRGRYFLAVRAKDRSAGPYELLRASRTITKSSLSVGSVIAAPGVPRVLTMLVTPPVDGPVSFELEQHDPLSGWQYVRRLRGEAVAGVATASFTAPSVGRWRARATYVGTRGRAPSLSGFAPFSVDRPLQE